jgi:hypothetical protein
MCAGSSNPFKAVGPRLAKRRPFPATSCRTTSETHISSPFAASQPVPALFAAPDPLSASKDASVSASDAQAVFAYFKKAAKTGSPEYEQDLNGNGVKDGFEYDRSYLGPAQTGPPDGIVSASDAQLAFAQFKLGYAC